MTTVTNDKFLDGRVDMRQPGRGFRSGLDAVMLAAAVPAASGDRVLELGCGAGTASLCLAARVERCCITGIDIHPALVDLANGNARMNGFETRLDFCVGDALSLPRSMRGEFDHVFCNPPFHGRLGEPSPDTDRALALDDEGRLSEWLRNGFKRARSSGSFTVIVRADRLGEVLHCLPPTGVTVFPLWPRSDEPAKRVIVQARKGARTPLLLLPGLVLHENDGQITRAANAVMRDAASLALASRPL